MRKPTWTCTAWLGDRRCGNPTDLVDPVLLGPCCTIHRRTTLVQRMNCDVCEQVIAPGQHFSYVSMFNLRRDGLDAIICSPCFQRLIAEVKDAFRARIQSTK